MIVIDAKDQILGRIGVVAAKQALLGEEIVILNADQAVISGAKEFTFAKYKRKKDMGVPKRGPYYPRMPDRLARRMIRGMLPMDHSRGRAAYKRIMCYIGTPADFAGKHSITVPGANASKLPTTKKATIAEICHHMGARWN
jgi:large subunit ribosomal protein L13